MELILAVLAGIFIGLTAGIFIGKKFFADNKELELKANLYKEEKAKAEALALECEALKTRLTDLKVKEGVLEAEKRKFEVMQARQEEYFSAIQSAAKAQFGELAAKLLKEKAAELGAKNLELLTPLNENIEKFKAEIKSLEKETIDKTARLETKLTEMQSLNRSLAKEAGNLTQALQNKKAQGNLGEMILEDVLQAVGLKEGVHYSKQEFLRSESGAKNYPDFIINLPDNRRVIIDSKMSLADYSKWVNETDEALKEGHIKAHAEAVRNHIKSLSGKEYQRMLKEQSLDFVFMFIPVEYAYISALEYDKNLSSWANEKRVAVVTGSSLLPIIQILEGIWRIDKTSKSMAEIVRNGEEMHKKAVSFLYEMERLGLSMKSSQNSYEEAMGKLRGRGGILSRAQALEKLGVKTGKSLTGAVDEGDDMKHAGGLLLGTGGREED
jgi:DNA recombination protein RmuC